MKIVSWNVNGIRASWSHGLAASLDECNADIYAFQETKTNEEISMIELEGYRAYWSFCTRRKGYSGTLCLTKQKPLNIRYDMGDFDFDTEGRIITLEFEDFFFVNCYVPNSQRSDRRYDYRSSWDFMLLQYLIQLRCQKPTIACGDFNVPISDKDIYEENKWVELNAEGYQSTERESLLEIIDCGYIDTYRLLHPDETGKYTWWSNRRFKRKENRGWRLDYFLVSKKLRDKVTESTMLSDVYGSDHAMKAKKHLYDHIIYDSSNEQKFATELGTNTNVAVYVKLPDGFYISTPVGHYNPDWAIAFYEGTVKHIYFVAETKGSMNSMQLRLIEESKIHCAREHFKAISNGEVVYDVVDSYQSLLDLMTK